MKKSLLFIVTALFCVFISKTYGQDEFITTWKTDNPGINGNNTIVIPTYHSEIYNFTVDWGDGSTDTTVQGDIFHTYAAPGTYTVKITGVFPRIYFYNTGDEEKLMTVEQWGNNPWTSMERAFYGCSNLDVTAIDTPDLTHVSALNGMFERCSSLVGNTNFNGWDVSNVTNMNSMFAFAPIFNQDIGGWDVSNVTDMSAMFSYASSFNQNIGNWNVASVIDMTAMFQRASAIDQNISGWDVSNVTSMIYMFAGATTFNQNIGVWNVTNVTDMTAMFQEASAFNQNIGGWDVSNVTDMTNMFIDASNFNQNIGGWNVSNVTDMSFMFINVSLSTVNYDALLNGWAGQTVKPNVNFDGGNSQYADATIARQSLIDDFGWTITDGGQGIVGPQVVSIFPVDGATGVPLDTPITVTFDRNIVPGEGESLLSTDTNFISFALSLDLNNVIIQDNTVTFIPDDTGLDLDPNSVTTLNIPNNAFKDEAGNLFEGTSWSFSMVTTSDTDLPVGILTPPTGTSEILSNQIFQIEFNEEVVNKSGTIALTDIDGNQLAVFDENKFDLQFNGTNSILTFQLTPDIIQLQTNTGYRINVPPYSFEDVTGNDYPGTSVASDNSIEPGLNWQFTTGTIMEDTEAPTITCPGPLSKDAGPKCSTTIVLTEPTASDNVSSSFNYEGSRSDGAALTDPFYVGATTISWTATDEAGNVSDACEQIITISSSGNCWEKVGGDLISDGDANNLDFAKGSNGQLYIAYRDVANGNQLAVKFLNNGSWETVGQVGYANENYFIPSIALDNGNIPYVAFYDWSLSRHIIKRFINNAWENFGGTVGGVGLELGTPIIKFSPQGELHIVYLSLENKLTMKKWNGASWATLGTELFSNATLSYDFEFDTAGVPYVAYQELDQVQRLTVQRFIQNGWQFVGPERFSQGTSGSLTIGIDPFDVPYVVYYDSGGTNIVLVQAFNGSDWITIGDSPNLGLAETISIDFDSFGTAYIGFKGGLGQRVVKKLENNHWVPVGGSSSIVAANAFEFAENMLICMDNSDVNNPVLYTAIAREGILVRNILPGLLDTTAPVVICPQDIIEVVMSATPVVVSLTDPTASDNESTTFTFTGIRSDGLPLADPYPLTETTITWTATDEAGNTSDPCEQVVTVLQAETEAVLEPDGSLSIVDSNGGNTDDGFTLSLNGANLVISSTSTISITGGNSVQIDANTVEIPLSDITGGLTIDGAGGNNTVDIVAPLALLGPDNGLTLNNVNTQITGTGTVQLNNLNVSNGDYDLNGLTTEVATIANFYDGATLGGNGNIVGALNMNAGSFIAPGTSPGIVGSGDLILENGATFDAEVNGPTPGTDYDQVEVTGAVTINDATLNLIGGYANEVGDEIILISNDDTDPITGTFTGLIEGASVNFGDYNGTISYVGGDGNDVVLEGMVLPNGPIINVWYGDIQEFGNNGVPQPWCNISGNITDDGSISSITYSLNGGTAINLSIGPDNRRLENSGDFNIDIDVANLLPGTNTVVISAMDNDNNTSTNTVTVNYTDGTVWPIPYNVDWSSLNNDITKVNEVAHVVDGIFSLTPDGIRTAEPGYDRLIAMGDITSTNYEVLVPVTIHNMPSDGGVGVLLRWKGHTDTPVVCPQPKCGYLPLGAISWFRSSRLEFYQGNNVNFTPSIDVTYMLRTSVETDAATGNTLYRLKVWEQGTAEPVAWNLEQTNGTSDEQEGSLMLIAHKADVTFGNVTVTSGSLSISNIQAQLSNNNTEATVTWNTNQPTTSRVDYGPTTAYEDGFVDDSNLVTSHSITLTGLTPESIYQYKISGENSGTEAIERTDLILSTFTSGIKSDDFCGNTLDPVWNFDNPLNDGSFALTGSGTNDAFLEISVPAGPEHQIFTSGINAPNLMQTINNSDFEVEVKFESGVDAPQYQEQGILVKESATRFLRFEFFSSNADGTKLYAQAYELPTAIAAFVNVKIAANARAPLYMRVKREGNEWTQSYSFDGTNFTVGTTFTYAMVPTEIGPYAGNGTGNNAPGHTAKIDYFHNLAEPITSEDGCDTLQPPVLASIGNLSVEEDGNLSLTLTATDADGNDVDIDFSETGLPSFAQLTDNGDGSALLTITPALGNLGSYPITITVTDSDGLTDEEILDIVVIEPGSGGMNIVSDDFCDNVLDPVWTFNDPLGDGSYLLAGSGTSDALLEIAVPSGVAHQLWVDGIQSPHIIQTANDTDFELEVKIESPVGAPQYQEQGILVRQDDYHFLRFEIYSTNTDTKALSAILESATNSFPLGSNIPVNTNIGPLDTAPIYMRVKREGNQWTQSYSLDGQNWTVAGTFSHSMVVSGVGLYGGNGLDSNAPAHTAKFDYFQSLNDAIVTEDGCNVQQRPVLASIGNLSVEEDGNLSLTLTATDADGNDVDIDFTETGLPSFAQLTDNGDGSALFTIAPAIGDMGTYPITITVTDSNGLTDEEILDIVVLEQGAGVNNIVSDDFCNNELSQVWTFNNPLTDGSFTFSGSGTEDAFLEISVPAGPEHQMWINGIQAPHIIQASNNTDFELEVKMESALNAPRYQEQGILIRQDDYHFLRFEFYSNTSNTFMIAAILESTTNSLPLDSNIPVNTDIGPLNTAPMFMRVKREGDQWTQSYSFDGQNWVLGGSFSFSMTVSGVGLYGGNGTGATAPAHTAQFDYFKNLEDPITDEDGCGVDVAPSLVSLDPMDEATDVILDAVLIATFDEPVQWASAGAIVIQDLTDAVLFETFNSLSTALTFSGNTLNIDPELNFMPGHEYEVQISGSALEDLAGNAFTGIAPLGWTLTAVTEPPVGEFSLRINTGGSQATYGGEVFAADTYFDTGSTLDRPQTGLPEPFQSFRYSPSKQLGYDIPIPDGEYTVNLYFAELWFGATGGGSGGVGSRVFDVRLEGQLVEDNLDVFAQVGAQTMLVRSHTVQVTGGVLDIDLNSNDAVGGARHPVINAIEILGETTSTVDPSISELTLNLGPNPDAINLTGGRVMYSGCTTCNGRFVAGVNEGVGSVHFVLNGPISFEETTNDILGGPQLFLEGSDHILPPGAYTLTATPYSAANKGGEMGPAISTSFNAQDGFFTVLGITDATSCTSADGGAIISTGGGIPNGSTWSHDPLLDGSAFSNDMSPGDYRVTIHWGGSAGDVVFDYEIKSLAGEDCPGPDDFALRINTGGSEATYSGEVFAADTYFDTGSTLDRPQTGLPEPFQSFRYSPSKQLGYDIPIPDGEYTVNLYFAELWFGATGGGSGGVGSRVFDVRLEGQLVEDNLDVFAQVGAQTMLVRSHTVQVTGGVLDIDLNSNDAVGGVRHPVINAIEVIGASTLVLKGSTGSDLKTNAMTLYPNEAITVATVGFEKPTKVSQIMIFDMSGRLIESYNPQQIKNGDSYILNVNFYQEGTYIVKMIDSNGMSFQKQMLVKRQ